MIMGAYRLFCLLCGYHLLASLSFVCWSFCLLVCPSLRSSFFLVHTFLQKVWKLVRIAQHRQHIKALNKQLHQNTATPSPRKTAVLLGNACQVPALQTAQTANHSTRSVAAHAAAHQKRVVFFVANQLQRILNGAFVQGVPRIDVGVVVVVDHAHKLYVDVLRQTVVEKVLHGLFTGQPENGFEMESLQEQSVDYAGSARSVQSFFHGAKIERWDDPPVRSTRDSASVFQRINQVLCLRSRHF
ncbi:hypothetical protein CLUG_05149 [Clavispora lusitaniae ATCC 42720]|uniref:Uncharacterized protein n=1 Tax=Clavispora lusitaniae (strain ATCC 42720) TaxID=306902 RepID=C4Y9S8_CLAL4|nr:uncharacterized protein CLUG_05149 [Clavispora lusitaniae ATCC 42720]EEQ41022.1 hypothetical protein CLUG_05149 [Clavispora lusitaniae ATCC 42720]